jgi:hypothetical protein
VNRIHHPARERNPLRTADIAIYEGGRVVGAVRTTTPGKPFVKNVVLTLHRLRNPVAYAVGLESLTSAEALGSELVILHERDTGDTYSAPIATIRERGFRIDRGHGAQLVLVLGEWSRNGEIAPAETKRQHQAAKASDDGQLTLFDFAEPQRIGAY